MSQDIGPLIETRTFGEYPRLMADVARSQSVIKGEEPVPLILLHGIGGHRRNWSGDLVELAKDRLVVAADARGYGDSDDYDGPVTIAQMAGDVLLIMDELSLPHAFLLGLSLGSSVAIEASFAAPDRIRGLVLVAAAPLLSRSLTPDQRARFLAERQAPLLAGGTPADIAASVTAGLLGPNASKSVRSSLESSIAALHLDSYIKTIAATIDYQPSRPLVDIACPTLVLHGSMDPLVPKAVAQDTAAQITSSRLLILDGVGHIVNLEDPVRFRSAVRGWARELDEPHRSSTAALRTGD